MTSQEESAIRNSIIRLQYIAAGVKPRWRVFGICFNANFEYLPCSIRSDIDDAIRQWPEFSGSLAYPIGLNLFEASHLYDRTRDKYVGEYGEARRRLAQYLADHLQKLL